MSLITHLNIFSNFGKVVILRWKNIDMTTFLWNLEKMKAKVKVNGLFHFRANLQFSSKILPECILEWRFYLFIYPKNEP